MRIQINFFRKPARIIGIFLLAFPSIVLGQGDSVRNNPDVLRFADVVLYTYSAPIRWDGKDWLILGGLVAGTSALTFLDHPTQNFWQDHHNRFMNGVERVGYHYGKPYTAVGISAGFYLTGLIFRNTWAKETGLILGSSIFSSSFLMGILKTGVGRQRPGPDADNLHFKPFDKSPAFHSFPSGHSSVAFGISIVLARRIDNVPLKVFFYSLAGTTAVSRMYSDSHWISDIAFGGMIAWFCADTALKRIQTNRFRQRKRNVDGKFVWNVHPYPGGITLRGTVR